MCPVRIHYSFPVPAGRPRRNSAVPGSVSVLLAALLLGMSAGAQAEEDRDGLLNGAARFTQEYLADKRRAGALVGSLLGTALTVHPAGSIVGSILGFWIGKATMHDDPSVRAAARSEGPLDPRRSIIPADGSAVASLSFSEQGEARQLAPEAGGVLAMPTLAILPGSAPASPLAPLGGRLPVPPSRDQLAMLCSNGAGSSQDQRLRKACFYFQGY